MLKKTHQFFNDKKALICFIVAGAGDMVGITCERIPQAFKTIIWQLVPWIEVAKSTEGMIFERTEYFGRDLRQVFEVRALASSAFQQFKILS